MCRGNFLSKTINVQTQIRPCKGDFFLKINKRACTFIRHTWVLGRMEELRLDPNPDQDWNTVRLSEQKFKCKDIKDTDLSWVKYRLSSNLDSNLDFFAQPHRIIRDEGWIVTLCNSDADSGKAEWALAHPEFGVSVNPIPTRGQIMPTACPPGFQNLAAFLYNGHITPFFMPLE